ncbi:MAG: IclR family transcriptional regulator NdgR [Mycobacteriales bacterium]
MDYSSGVGVLDKSVALIAAVEQSPASLAELVERTGIARPTAHRLAVALEHYGLLGRDPAGRFVLGARLSELGASRDGDSLPSRALPVLTRLRDETAESAQLYRRDGAVRVCVAAAERASGLRDTVPVGAALPMTAGSAAQVLTAWAPPAEVQSLLGTAAFTAATLTGVRRRGWAASVGEREAGVASVSAPVRDTSGNVVAAVSVSGPIDRLGRRPGARHAAAVLRAATELSGP